MVIFSRRNIYFHFFYLVDVGGIKMNDVEYWNDVANKTINTNNNTIKENVGKKRQIIQKLLEFNFADNWILEIGVGNGFIGSIIKKINFGCSYRGIDISPRFVKTAKLFGGLNVREGRITDIPFSDNIFSVFFLFDVMEHIRPKDRIKAYKEIKRVGKDKIMVFLNNPLSVSGHDKDFDFGFSDVDLTEMAVELNLRLAKIDVIKKEECGYQFVTMAPLIRKK